MEKIHADCALDDLPPDISENERCWALQSEIYCAQNETEDCDREHEVEDYYACRVDDYNYEYSCQITTSGVCIDVISDFCHLGDVTSCAPLGALSRPEAGRVLHALEFDMSSTDLCTSLNKLDQPKEVLQCWLKACLPEESGDKVVKEMLSACDSVMQTTEEPRSSSSTGSDVISSPPPTADISLTVIDVESIKMLRPTANKFVKKGPVSERDMTSPSGTAGLANQKYFATILCFGVVFFFMENM